MAIELSPLLRRCLDRTIAVLAEEFRGVFSRETVVRYVEESFDRLGDRPTVVEAMSELGVDVTLEFPKPLTDEVVRAADVVVTLGCGDACALYPGKRYLDWPVTDPAGRSLRRVREIRYELYHHVWELVETLVPAADLLELHRSSGGQR